MFGFAPDGGEGVDHGDEVFGIEAGVAALNLVKVFARAGHGDFLGLAVEGLRKVVGRDFGGLFLEFGVSDELVEFGFEGGGV